MSSNNLYQSKKRYIISIKTYLIRNKIKKIYFIIWIIDSNKINNNSLKES
jgi:hypothetical protein